MNMPCTKSRSSDMARRTKQPDKKSARRASVPRTDKKDLLKKVPKLKKIKPGRGNR